MASTVSPLVSEVVDLTDVPESDDELDEQSSEIGNSIGRRLDCPETLSKFCYTKVVRKSKLKIIRDTRAEHVNYSLFSQDSLDHLKELEDGSKSTYVGYSLNPYLERGLYAGQKIRKGQFICLYYGLRMSYKECDARQKRGRPPNFALRIPLNVVIDALGYPYGGGMCNHSCVPNAKLEYGFLRGAEHAPYAFIEAVEDIEAGSEIMVNYGYLNSFNQDEVRALLQSGNFIPCKCLRPKCGKIFCPRE